MRTHGERHADQGAIWSDIDAKAERMAAPSPTRAAAAMYEQVRADLDAFQAVGFGEDLRLRSPRIAGAALAVDQQLVHLLAYAC